MRYIIACFFWFFALNTSAQYHHIESMFTHCTLQETPNPVLTQTHFIELLSFKHAPNPDKNSALSPRLVLIDNGSYNQEQILEKKLLLSSSSYGQRILQLLNPRVDEKSAVSISYCYTPRNAIALYDQNQQLLEVVEICFECNRIELKKGKLPLTAFCSPYLTELKSIFYRNHIQYGIKQR